MSAVIAYVLLVGSLVAPGDWRLSGPVTAYATLVECQAGLDRLRSPAPLDARCLAVIAAPGE